MTCQIHGYHWPKPLRIVTHHIQPLAAGGLDVPENRVDTCDTGHMNLHRILDALWKGAPIPGGTRKERRLAQQGYDAWIAAGKPGHPVFEDHKPIRQAIATEKRIAAAAPRAAKKAAEKTYKRGKQ